MIDEIKKENDITDNSSTTESNKKFDIYRGIIGIVLLLATYIFLVTDGFTLSTLNEEEVTLSLFDAIFGNSELKMGLNPIGLTSFILISCATLLFIVGFIFKIAGNKKASNSLFISSSITLFLGYIFYLAIIYTFYYVVSGASEIIPSEYGIYFVTPSMIIYSVIIAISLIMILASIERKDGSKFKVKEISELAMMVALAIVLDQFVKIPIGSTGGSINFSAFPLMIYGIRHGFLKGILASSIIFGIITNLIDGYGLLCYPFDYLIAFLGYGSSGLFYYIFKSTIFKNKSSENDNLILIIISLILGAITLFIIRMIGSTMSSMILWEYELGAALLYNILYVGPSALGCLVISLLLSPVINMINKRQKTSYLEKLA